MNWQQENEDYQRIEKAIQFIETHAHEQPELSEIASNIGLSEFHFQRLFTRWAGISPKRFLQFITKEKAKEMLERSATLLEVTYQTGLSSPGRLHDLFITWEAATPGEYKLHGEGLHITYGFAASPFGECLLAKTNRGLCSLFFTSPKDRHETLLELQKQWEKASLLRDDQEITILAEEVFSFFRKKNQNPLYLHLIGTPFQHKVWEALLRIPAGCVVSYEDLARLVHKPGCARAVSGAVARNPTSVLIPCHRVIRKMGEMGGYRWGIPRKKALLGWEFARYSG